MNYKHQKITDNFIIVYTVSQYMNIQTQSFCRDLSV